MKLFIKINLLFLCFLFLFSANARSEEKIVDLSKLSIEELMNIKVTSVSKKEGSVFDSAAAVYVISSEDIRRSGVRSIPEALRLAPGVEVAQIDANKWAISIRGFNERFSRRLLVLIDGRSIYTPLFAGIQWEEIDTLLEDIDRIEVIRGPGGTLWGSNAVNGVINIITKNAKDTQGGYFEAGGGNEEQGFVSFRYGSKIGEDINYRFYGKFTNRDDFVDLNRSSDAHDERKLYQGGFRSDWSDNSNKITLQGDIYKVDFEESLFITTLESPFEEIVESDAEYFGGNILFRWNHIFSNSAESSLQLYYYGTDRSIFFGDEVRHTFDADFQYNFPKYKNNDLIAGVGLRFISDDIDTPTGLLSLRESSRTDFIYSAFIQNTLSIFNEKLDIIVGSKIEHNDYSGFEVQPNVRFIVKPNESNRFWGAVSKAVRTPSRVEDGLSLVSSAFIDPNSQMLTIFRLNGNEDFDPEELLAFELGYRYQYSEKFFLELAGFINKYNKLRTFEPGEPILQEQPVPAVIVPLNYDNKADATTYGFEINSSIKPTDFWSLNVSYSFLKIDIDGDDSFDISLEDPEGSSPENQFKIQSFLNLPWNLEFDSTIYYIDDLETFNISDYLRFDSRLGWKPFNNVEISVVGQNLFDKEHREFGRTFFNVPSVVERSIYGSLSWKF